MGDPDGAAAYCSESHASTRTPSSLSRAYDDELDSIIDVGPSTLPRSYGTLPIPSRHLTNPPSIRRTIQHVPSNLSTIPPSSTGRLNRPISAYDDLPQVKGDAEPETAANVNGIRVWYSSFTSIDWLHDIIKDSLRFSGLRKHKSLRGRLYLAFDKSLGWIIVTIVGCLTAVVAFLIVRTEQLLFDVKEGYCGTSWWKSKIFCCPHFDDNLELIAIRGDQLFKEMCPAWRTWEDVLSRDQVANQGCALEYVSYTCIAVSVTCLVSLLENNTDTSSRYALQ
jgi:chloride channel 3/4/5